MDTTWVRLDDDFPQHPKVVQAGPLGFVMHVSGICYSNRYLTDGFIPSGVLNALLPGSSARIERLKLIPITINERRENEARKALRRRARGEARVAVAV